MITTVGEGDGRDLVLCGADGVVAARWAVRLAAGRCTAQGTSADVYLVPGEAHATAPPPRQVDVEACHVGTIDLTPTGAIPWTWLPGSAVARLPAWLRARADAAVRAALPALWEMRARLDAAREREARGRPPRARRRCTGATAPGAPWARRSASTRTWAG